MKREMMRGVIYIVGLMSLCGLLMLGGCSQEAASNPESEAQASDTETYKPSPYRPEEVGERLVGPVVYTIDSRSKEMWMYFDFSRGSVVHVDNPKTGDWDLSIRRHVIRTNGGATSPNGQAAMFAIEDQDFSAVTRVLDGAEFVSDVRAKKRLHPYNRVVDRWYKYSYTTNVLLPKPIVYLVRTQEGKYAKMRIVSYYCKGNLSGCMTIEYVYQGDGSRNLTAPPA
ncbi:hypothetical protein C2W62_00845 [Candidatus Entotheonella serta]|nr:hypothetical protein C2W62_00845 [Candidatus Entotheonella serta]